MPRPVDLPRVCCRVQCAIVRTAVGLALLKLATRPMIERAMPTRVIAALHALFEVSLLFSSCFGSCGCSSVAPLAPEGRIDSHMSLCGMRQQEVPMAELRHARVPHGAVLPCGAVQVFRQKSRHATVLRYNRGMQRCCDTTAACNGVVQRRAVQDEESTVRYAMLDKLSSLYLATSASAMLPPAYLAFVALFAGEDDKQKCAKVRH